MRLPPRASAERCKRPSVIMTRSSPCSSPSSLQGEYPDAIALLGLAELQGGDVLAEGVELEGADIELDGGRSGSGQDLHVAQNHALFCVVDGERVGLAVQE